MLKFGDVFQNLLTIAILFGFGYIIYLKWIEKKGGDNIFKGLFSKTEGLSDKVKVKGGDLIGK